MPRMTMRLHPTLLLCGWDGFQGCANCGATSSMAACPEMEAHLLRHGELHPYADEPPRCLLQHAPSPWQPYLPDSKIGPLRWRLCNMQFSTTK
ncbi:hypothetical protein ACHAW6_001039 [Cyclotella cf. meneghiniana]